MDNSGGRGGGGGSRSSGMPGRTAGEGSEPGEGSVSTGGARGHSGGGAFDDYDEEEVIH